MTNPEQHLLDIESLTAGQLVALLDQAQAFKDDPAGQRERCRDRLLINLFYEPSTRTRVSFEVAAQRLGMQVVNIAASGSSVSKGESLLDTYHTLQAMGPDIIVVRHPENGALAPLAAQTRAGIHLVNGGDGSRAHPTQGLLDAMTIRQRFPELSGISVLVAGDLHHSRVTRSSVAVLKKLGVGEIRLAAPPGLQAGPRVSEGTVLFDNLDKALQGVDVVMMLRIQKERLIGIDVPNAETYHREWGLTDDRLNLTSPGCIVMHPGPMNRGVEIASDVAYGSRSVILQQVENGVFVRMSAMATLLGR